MTAITENTFAAAMRAAFAVAENDREAFVPVMDTVTIDGKEYSRHTNFSVRIDSRTGESHPFGVYSCDQNVEQWFVTVDAAVEFATRHV